MIVPENAYQVKFYMDFNILPLLKLRIAEICPNAGTSLIALVMPHWWSPQSHLSIRLYAKIPKLYVRNL